MWMLIAAVGAGVFIYQFLTELLKGRYSILETRLNEIAGIGETSQKQVKRWEGSLMSRMGKAALERHLQWELCFRSADGRNRESVSLWPELV